MHEGLLHRLALFLRIIRIVQVSKIRIRGLQKYFSGNLLNQPKLPVMSHNLLDCACVSANWGCVNIFACPIAQTGSLWDRQTAQNTLTQIFAKNWTCPQTDSLRYKISRIVNLFSIRMVWTCLKSHRY